MAESEEPANLPALVTNQGGALVAVLSWKQYLVALNRTQQTQVAIMVRSFPELNTEAGVDMLADAMLFYGVRFDGWFAGLLEQHGIDTITIVLEILHAYSVVGGVEDMKAEKDQKYAEYAGVEHEKPATVQSDRERLELEHGLEVIAWLRDLGQMVDTFEQCDHLLDRLGGWPMVRLMDYNHLEAFFRGEVDLMDLRRLVDAPHDEKDGDWR